MFSNRNKKPDDMVINITKMNLPGYFLCMFCMHSVRTYAFNINLL